MCLADCSLFLKETITFHTDIAIVFCLVRGCTIYLKTVIDTTEPVVTKLIVRAVHLTPN